MLFDKKIAIEGCVLKRMACLLASLCVFCMSSLCADNHQQTAADSGRDQVAAARKVMLRDLITGKAVLGKKADAAVTRDWRRRNVRKVMQSRRPGDKAWIDGCTEQFLAGDGSCYEKIATEPVVVPGGPSKRPLVSKPGIIQGISGDPFYYFGATPSLAASVGMLLLQKWGEEPLPLCTISLVKPGIGLTALHCWEQVHGGDSLKVFFPYEGIRDVNLDTVKPFELSQQQSHANLAVFQPEVDLVYMEFNKPYTFISPESVATGITVVPDSEGTVMGYGFNVEDQFDYGISREATVPLRSCVAGDSEDSSEQEITGQYLCFSYDPNDPDRIAMMAYDSGGPMFQSVVVTGTQVELARAIIGVAKGGKGVDVDGSGLAQAVYLNLGDPFYQPWLTSHVSSSATTTNSEYQLIEVLAEDPVMTMSPFTDQVDYTFNISTLARELIFTMNHQPGPEMFPDNLDLQLPSTSKPDCIQLPTVEVCRIRCPQSGVFELSVGWGTLEEPDGTPFTAQHDVEYQMTAVSLLGSKNDMKCTGDGQDGM